MSSISAHEGNLDNCLPGTVCVCDMLGSYAKPCTVSPPVNERMAGYFLPIIMGRLIVVFCEIFKETHLLRYDLCSSEHIPSYDEVTLMARYLKPLL